MDMPARTEGASQRLSAPPEQYLGRDLCQDAGEYSFTALGSARAALCTVANG